MTPFRARPRPAAKPEAAHEYSCLMVSLRGDAASALQKMANAIPSKDLAADGIETEPHITCRFGLHFQTPSAKLKAALKDFGPITLTLGKTSLFENDDADVLKVDVDSPDLHRLYQLIGRVVPTHTTHPDYRPHATIGYLRKGKGKKYAGDKALVGQKLTFDSVLFSGKKGTRISLPLGAQKGYKRVR